jgi:Putative DNA-binding domain
VASLREQQRSFAASLRDPSIACAVLPAANLDIYRNNAGFNFHSALEAGFPVLQRRVGDDYFRQLAHHYRARFPSPSGDLHWVGQNFAAFLEGHLNGGDYAWLADLARIEWARQHAAVAVELPAVGADALAAFAPEELEHLVFTLQPSLTLICSAYPVFSVWLANQTEHAPPVDQSIGSEQGMVLIRVQSLEVRPVEARLFSYLSAVAGGATVTESMAIADLDAVRLRECLRFLFEEKLVSGLASKMAR